MSEANGRGRAIWVAGALAALLAGCSVREDDDVPTPSPIRVTASISADRISVTPRRFGPGPISLVVTNLTRDSQQVTLRGEHGAALRQETAPINPRDTATLIADWARELHRRRRGRPDHARHAARRAEGALAAVAPRPRPCQDRRMPARWLGFLAALALPTATAAAQAPQPSPQALFEATILADPRTTDAIAAMLRSDAAHVTSRPTFADLTGDRREDAVVTVVSGGAAGAVAVYTLSSDGTKSGRLRVVFRTQSLFRARTKVAAADAHRHAARLRDGRRPLLPRRPRRARLRLGGRPEAPAPPRDAQHLLARLIITAFVQYLRSCKQRTQKRR